MSAETENETAAGAAEVRGEPGQARIVAEFPRYRRELTGYCYRMLGSFFEAEDAVQETMIRAWRRADTFEGRAALRTWLHRIATNVCLDMLRGRGRRALPMGLVPRTRADAPAAGAEEPLPESRWVMPAPDGRLLPDTADPAEHAAAGESIRLAFVAVLQHLPARQRAVLILCDVLAMPAAEAAAVLDTSPASVTSALQRARRTLAERRDGPVPPRPDDAVRDALLTGYVEAFEAYDIARLTSLLRDDVVQSMPPFTLWLRGASEVGRWMLGPGIGCAGSRLLRTAANGTAAFGQYRSDGRGGHRAFSVNVVEIDAGADRICRVHSFIEPRLFPLFGLPDTP